MWIGLVLSFIGIIVFLTLHILSEKRWGVWFWLYLASCAGLGIFIGQLI